MKVYLAAFALLVVLFLSNLEKPVKPKIEYGDRIGKLFDG